MTADAISRISCFARGAMPTPSSLCAGAVLVVLCTNAPVVRSADVSAVSGITHAAPRTASPFAGARRTLVARNRDRKGRSAMTASNGQAGNRGSGNGSAATSREAGPDPAKPLQFQPTSETAGGTASAQKVSLMEFSFKGQRVRPVLLDGETWFVAADVCAVLEHTQPSKAVLRLDDDEKGVTTVPTLGGSQEMLVVSESGLYALIFSSRKPEARAFRRWVTGEVLPAIRKTDRYEMGQLPPCPERFIREEITLTLPGHGRYVVATRPDRPPHVHRTGYDELLRDATDTDCRILAHQLKLIESLWRKTRENKSVGLDDRDGFAWGKLEDVILEGGYLALHYLAVHD